MTSRLGILLLLALLAVTGCARHATEKPASRLSEAERDTALARSSLPGASTVGRALDVSGQARGRVSQEDSLARR